MGGQPLFTLKAHVFQIDPETKKRWLPTSNQSVDVSFYHDVNRNLFRIISVEGDKVLINSTITQDMTFTRTSHKFGQWMDSVAGTTYGLGFPSEVEMNEFVRYFDDLKEKSEVEMNKDGLGEVMSTGTQSVDQMRYENDRLKIALAQSSSNAKKWETELQVLRNTNERLSTAIQESSTNVDKWNKQLTSLKEENTRLKLKVLEMEKTTNTCGSLEQQLNDVISRLTQAEKLLSTKDKELVDLKMKVESLQQVDIVNKRTKAQCQTAEEENAKLKEDVSSLQDRLQNLGLNKENQTHELKLLQDKFNSKIMELMEINEKMSEVI